MLGFTFTIQMSWTVPTYSVVDLADTIKNVNVLVLQITVTVLFHKQEMLYLVFQISGLPLNVKVWHFVILFYTLILLFRAVKLNYTLVHIHSYIYFF